MTVTTQFRVTVRCDVCGKIESMEFIGGPPHNNIPAAWIQTAPPGQTSPKEFCSVECLSKWKSDVKPWEED